MAGPMSNLYMQTLWKENPFCSLLTPQSLASLLAESREQTADEFVEWMTICDYFYVSLEIRLLKMIKLYKI